MNNARTNEGLLRGVNLAIDEIRPTYGPYGTNKAIECDEYPYNKIVNDAKTIIDALQSQDKEERQGLNLVKELMNTMDSLSGDGRKTTAIMAGALINSDIEMPVVRFKKELDALIPFVEGEIDKVKREITVDEVDQVATIAGESEEFGKLLKEIYQYIGKDGIIHLEPSGTPNTSYMLTEGIRFADSGYLSPSLVNDSEAVKSGITATKAVYEKPAILVTKRRISKISEIDPILFTLRQNGRGELVIFTDDMDTDVARVLINLHVEKKFKILVIKAPVMWKQHIFEDFAKCVGATIVEDATGLTFKNFPMSALGECDKLIVDSKETIIIGSKDISEHIASLKKDNSFENKLRLSWLTTKTANLLLGANGENDLYYKTMKMKDAISASRLALQDGVVEGGGKCLLEIANSMFSEGDETTKVLKRALTAPYTQLCINANTGSIDTNGIMDASLVLKNAIRSAIGLASTALTIGGAIPFLDKTPEELALLSVNKRMF